jgi:cytochrome P450
MCPAARFAMVESKLVIAMLLQHFEICVDPSEDILPVYGLVGYPSKEIQLQLKHR